MNVFFVIAHAEPQSFNHAMLNAGRLALEAAGHEVRVSDLYAMHFDPVSDHRNFTTEAAADDAAALDAAPLSPDITAELEKLAWCDLLVFQFPLLWSGLPAILKGWADRVLAVGRAYGGGQWYDPAAFAGKRAVCSLTTGGPISICGRDGLSGDIHMLLQPIHQGIFHVSGFSVAAPQIVFAPAQMTPTQRSAALEAWGRRLPGLARETPLSFGERVERPATPRAMPALSLA